MLLSVLPDASDRVYIQLPTGGQLAVPPSTQSETIWFALADGFQFTYAALRCCVEFDYDHSISHSMKPPEVPHITDHVSTFSDNDMLADLPNLRDDSNTSKVLAKSTHQTSVANTAVQSSSSDKENVLPKRAAPLKEISEQAIQGNHESAFKDSPKCLPPPFQQDNEKNSGLHAQHKENSQAPPFHRPGIETHPKLARENQVVHVSKPRTHGQTFRNPGEESQVIPDESAMIPKSNARKHRKVLEEIRAKESIVQKVMGEDSDILQTREISSNVCTVQSSAVGRGAFSAGAADGACLAISTAAAAASRLREKEGLPSTRSSKPRLALSPDVLTPTIPKKRPIAEVSGKNSSPRRSRARLASPPSETKSAAIDVSTTSTITVNVPPKRQNKRQQSLRSSTDPLDLPPEPAVVFSTNCDIQNKRRTMETFASLGGKVIDDIFKADILCVASEDGLKKTPKLILAVVLGHVIVTEDWIVECTRKRRFLHPGPYQPKDESREQEWGVKLPAALNQGRYVNVNLDQLFQDHKLYLTQQLQNQLSKTGNLEAFMSIGTAMGATAVRKRLPVKGGAKTVVLGVDDDFDALAVGKLGLSLYDKDVLIMSALRGKRQDETEEFKIGIPIKEEQPSQS